MLLCLSSGSSRRYRDDVRRSLAQPWGSVLQFRYLKRYFAAGVLEGTKNTKGPSHVLIAYLDLSDQSKVPEVVPCRFALLKEVAEAGTAVALQLELQEFAVASDVADANREIREKAKGNVPVWEPDGEKKKAKGDYCLEVKTDPATISRSQKLDDWEKIVAELAKRADFKEETSFYTMLGITETPSKAAIAVNQGKYDLRPGREYEVDLYHFYPKDSVLTDCLTLTTTSQWLTFTRNPTLQLDSRYDLKHTRFKTGKPTSGEDIWLSVTRNTKEAGMPQVEFDLIGHVGGNRWQTLAYGLVLGCLLAGPQIITTLTNPNLPPDKTVSICIACGLIGLLTGVLAAFGLKKSP